MAGIGLGTNADLAINDPTYANEGTAAALAASQAMDYTTYTVVRGDTLSKIAGKLLGDPMRWKEIFNINSQLQDPNSLTVGQILNVPASAVAVSSDPNKSLPGPVHQAIAVAMPNADGTGDTTATPSMADDSSAPWYNSPTFILAAAGIGLAIILMSGKKKAA
jgi:LysM repeat protein